VRPRKVVTEITIETNHVLVIKRKQVIRSRSSECAIKAEFVRPGFVRPNRGNVPADETWNPQVVGASCGAPHSSEAPDGSDPFYRRSLLGATNLAKRFLGCLRRGSKRESETPRLQGQNSRGVDKA